MDPSFHQDPEPAAATLLPRDVDSPDLSKRAQWLRAAVLGANDGILSIASLMMGVGAVRGDPGSMIVAGIAGLIAGACSMAIGELVSVYSQYDIEYAQIEREAVAAGTSYGVEERAGKLPNPWQAALASALAFAAGAAIPLLAAGFVRPYWPRVGAMIGAVSLGLAGFGTVCAAAGKAPAVRSVVRVVMGGWVAMGITYALTKTIDAAGKFVGSASASA